MYSHQPELEVPQHVEPKVNDVFLLQLAQIYALYFGRMQGLVTSHVIEGTDCDHLYTESARLRGACQRAVRELCHRYEVDVDAPHIAI